MAIRMEISMKKIFNVILLFIMVLVLFLACDVNDTMSNGTIPKNENIVEEENLVQDNSESTSNNSTLNNTTPNDSLSLISSELTIHIIDVGQGDAILIKQGEYACLIDGGNNEDGESVSRYLRENGVKKLNYIIGTHPHEDHIGGLDVVINSIDVEKVILPDYTVTTKTYKDLLMAIKEKDLKITLATLGDEYTLGDSKFTIIAPVNKDYGDNPNNYSVGIKLEYGKTTFISVGDAEITAEKDILATGVDLTADILKVSHHGSHTSSSVEFLQAVDPIYAVISVGEDNKYGHPSSNVVTTLLEDDVQVYRTDEQGTVVITCDGEHVTFKCIPSQDAKEEKLEAKKEIVYITESGRKYHRPSCKFLNDSKLEIHKDDAISKGYTSCKVCNP